MNTVTDFEEEPVDKSAFLQFQIKKPTSAAGTNNQQVNPITSLNQTRTHQGFQVNHQNVAQNTHRGSGNPGIASQHGQNPCGTGTMGTPMVYPLSQQTNPAMSASFQTARPTQQSQSVAPGSGSHAPVAYRKPSAQQEQRVPTIAQQNQRPPITSMHSAENSPVPLHLTEFYKQLRKQNRAILTQEYREHLKQQSTQELISENHKELATQLFCNRGPRFGHSQNMNVTASVQHNTAMQHLSQTSSQRPQPVPGVQTSQTRPQNPVIPALYNHVTGRRFPTCTSQNRAQNPAIMSLYNQLVSHRAPMSSQAENVRKAGMHAGIQGQTLDSSTSAGHPSHTKSRLSTSSIPSVSYSTQSLGINATTTTTNQHSTQVGSSGRIQVPNQGIQVQSSNSSTLASQKSHTEAHASTVTKSVPSRGTNSEQHISKQGQESRSNSLQMVSQSSNKVSKQTVPAAYTSATSTFVAQSNQTFTSVPAATTTAVKQCIQTTTSVTWTAAAVKQSNQASTTVSALSATSVQQSNQPTASVYTSTTTTKGPQSQTSFAAPMSTAHTCTAMQSNKSAGVSTSTFGQTTSPTATTFKIIQVQSGPKPALKSLISSEGQQVSTNTKTTQQNVIVQSSNSSSLPQAAFPGWKPSQHVQVVQQPPVVPLVQVGYVQVNLTNPPTTKVLFNAPAPLVNSVPLPVARHLGPVNVPVINTVVAPIIHELQTSPSKNQLQAKSTSTPVLNRAAAQNIQNIQSQLPKNSSTMHTAGLNSSTKTNQIIHSQSQATVSSPSSILKASAKTTEIIGPVSSVLTATVTSRTKSTSTPVLNRAAAQNIQSQLPKNSSTMHTAGLNSSTKTNQIIHSQSQATVSSPSSILKASAKTTEIIGPVSSVLTATVTSRTTNQQTNVPSASQSSNLQEDSRDDSIDSIKIVSIEGNYEGYKPQTESSPMSIIESVFTDTSGAKCKTITDLKTSSSTKHSQTQPANSVLQSKAPTTSPKSQSLLSSAALSSKPDICPVNEVIILDDESSQKSQPDILSTNEITILDERCGKKSQQKVLTPSLSKTHSSDSVIILDSDEEVAPRTTNPETENNRTVTSSPTAISPISNSNANTENNIEEASKNLAKNIVEYIANKSSLTPKTDSVENSGNETVEDIVSPEIGSDTAAAKTTQNVGSCNSNGQEDLESAPKHTEIVKKLHDCIVKRKGNLDIASSVTSDDGKRDLIEAQTFEGLLDIVENATFAIGSPENVIVAQDCDLSTNAVAIKDILQNNSSKISAAAAVLKPTRKIFHIYVCCYPKCVYSTNLLEQFKKHILAHPLQKNYTCGHCHEDSFPTFDSLLVHIQENLRKITSCPYCAFKTELRNEVVKSHIAKEHPDKSRRFLVNNEFKCYNMKYKNVRTTSSESRRSVDSQSSEEKEQKEDPDYVPFKGTSIYWKPKAVYANDHDDSDNSEQNTQDNDDDPDYKPSQESYAKSESESDTEQNDERQVESRNEKHGDSEESSDDSDYTESQNREYRLKFGNKNKTSVDSDHSNETNDDSDYKPSEQVSVSESDIGQKSKNGSHVIDPSKHRPLTSKPGGLTNREQFSRRMHFLYNSPRKAVSKFFGKHAIKRRKSETMDINLPKKKASKVPYSPLSFSSGIEPGASTSTNHQLQDNTSHKYICSECSFGANKQHLVHRHIRKMHSINGVREAKVKISENYKKRKLEGSEDGLSDAEERSKAHTTVPPCVFTVRDTSAKQARYLACSCDRLGQNGSCMNVIIDTKPEIVVYKKKKKDL